MKKLLSLIVATLFATVSFAQVDEVTLTVIGTGPNEEQATLQALRSALEQTFGTFVSANTTILNNKLIQDEIVSVSTGNVKNYNKLAVAKMANGQVSVSLSATISINKLISYAKSKGSKAEFAGSSYAANVKLIRLKAQSIEKSFDLLVKQLENIAKDMFSFKVELNGDPWLSHDKKEYYIPYAVMVYSDIASNNFYNMYHNTIKNFILSEEEKELCFNNGIETANINSFYKWGWLHHEIPYSKGNAYIPISEQKYVSYIERIAASIAKACNRWSVQEIGNPSNSYNARSYKPNNAKSVLGSNEIVSNESLYDEKYNALFIEYVNNRQFSPFALHEMKIPLSPKEIRDAKKMGTYNGVDYKTEYYGPEIITTYTGAYYKKICIKIPVNSMDVFKGVELVGVPASTIPAKAPMSTSTTQSRFQDSNTHTTQYHTYPTTRSGGSMFHFIK